MNRSLRVALAMVFVALSRVPAAAGPTGVQYQGRLLDASGNPVNGNVSVSVAVYTNEVSGVSVYAESLGSVAVSDGLYAFTFGTAAGFDAALAQSQCWLQLTVNGVALAPRQRLLNVPYARRATLAEGVADAVVRDTQVATDAAIAGAKVAKATTTTRGTVELAANGEIAAELAVQANDARIQGWTDDGAVVRLTTTADDVRIGATSGGAGKLYALAAVNNGVYGAAQNYGVFGNASVDRGVYGYAAQNYGVFGYAAQNYGVSGLASHNNGVYGYAAKDYGVYGLALQDYGVYGNARRDYGVYGLANSYGVYGNAVTNFGVYGYAAQNYGVYGFADSYGVYGNAVTNFGVYGYSAQNNAIYGYAAQNYGVYGNAANYGVLGYAGRNGTVGFALDYGVSGFALQNNGVSGNAQSNYGVYGYAGQKFGVFGNAAQNCGVYGYAGGNYGVVGNAAQKYGVYGYAVGNCGVYGTAANYGVYGWALNDFGGCFGSDSGKALLCDGDIYLVSGSVVRYSNGSFKAFTVDHPLDPAGAILRHFSAEGPEALVIYTGTAVLDVNGEAQVALPDYFAALARDPRVQLTARTGPMPNLFAPAPAGCRLFIKGGTPSGEVCWQVTAERNDAKAQRERVERPVEQRKGTPGAPAAGTYVSPECFGE